MSRQIAAKGARACRSTTTPSPTGTICHAGLLPTTLWHEIEALEDGTVFENIFRTEA